MKLGRAMMEVGSLREICQKCGGGVVGRMTSELNDFVRRTELPVTAAEAFAWHERPGAFARLSPPWQRVEVLRSEGGIRDGARVDLRTWTAGIAQTWRIEHRGYRAGEQFEDHLLSGPFSEYRHVHRFKPTEAGCMLEDEIRYRLPAGSLGKLLLGAFTRRTFDAVFRYRHALTRGDLSFSKSWPNCRGMRVAITGAGGLVGGELIPFLTTQGAEVVRLVRAGSMTGAVAGVRNAPWDPETGMVDTEAINGCDAVVHLAGANVAARRWSALVKRELVASRVGPTQRLAQALAKVSKPPKVLVCASAIGFYGDTGDEWVDESSPRGKGFLAQLCEDWESATKPAKESGIRVVCVRIGVVLSPKGGALGKLLPVFRAAAGGPAGSGRQWMSWISADDLIRVIGRCIADESLNGPVNAVAPEPVRNAEFGRLLGAVLGRPAVVPAPAFALRLAFGEMADEVLLASCRVRPGVLERAGHSFEHRELEAALRHLLGTFAPE